MSDYNWDDSEFGSTPADSSDAGNAMKLLREQLKQANKAGKEQAQKLAELQTTLAQRELGNLFEKHQVPQEFRELYRGEPSEDAVQEYIGKYGKLWGLDPKQANDRLPETEKQRREDVRRMNEASSHDQRPPEVGEPAHLSDVQLARMSEADLASYLGDSFTGRFGPGKPGVIRRY